METERALASQISAAHSFYIYIYIWLCLLKNKNFTYNIHIYIYTPLFAVRAHSPGSPERAKERRQPNAQPPGRATAARVWAGVVKRLSSWHARRAQHNHQGGQKPNGWQVAALAHRSISKTCVRNRTFHARETSFLDAKVLKTNPSLKDLVV